MKIYIGLTIRTMEKRWKEHLYKREDSYLHNAMRKHGKENFIIEQIDTAITVDELNEKEIYWIRFYNSTTVDIGYNIDKGGIKSTMSNRTKEKLRFAQTGKKRGPHSDETKEKIRVTQLGKKLSDEHKKKLSVSHLGKGHPQSIEAKEKIGAAHRGKKGQPRSIETRAKMSKASKGKKKTPEHIENTRMGKLRVKIRKTEDARLNSLSESITKETNG